MGENHEAKQKGDRAGECHPQPWGPLLHAEPEDNSHNSRGDQGESQQKSQKRCGKQRILKRDEAGDDVENAEQKP